ncbi:sugar phosphate isomerase/epimerase [candidate division KSB1 bacterium]|nr:sugar phosphate isomerase/epimerase [candidate division KSB1 bacterium]
MNGLNRRKFIKMTTAGVLGGTLIQFKKKLVNAASNHARDEKMPAPLFSLGLASYTFRHFNLEQTIAMTQRLGLTKISLKDMHLPLTTSPAEILAAARKVRAAGLDLYGCGVVYMKTEAEVKHAFEYAKTAGMRVIIGVPAHHLLELVQQQVQEYDLKVAIHNHGPGDQLYPSPASVYEKIHSLDPRIGLCLDLGHTVRLGLDPVDALQKYAARLIDVHLKDVSAPTAAGSTVEMGRGVMDIVAILRTLKALDYRGVTAFEFEKDEVDPLPGVAESVGYTRGILKVL